MICFQISNLKYEEFVELTINKLRTLLKTQTVRDR